MRRTSRTALALLSLSALVAGTTATGLRPAQAGARPARHQGGTADLVHGATLAPGVADQARRSHFTSTGHVGDVVAWPAFQTDDDGNASFYLKDFVLRGLGPHVEVWVAKGDAVSQGLDFPAGDCRNGTGFTTVDDNQVSYLVDQFESAIRPKEAAVFGLPDKRDGKDATLPTYAPGIPKNAYRGPGDRLVVLVDNFRDALFRDPAAFGPASGVVDDTQMSFVDRNVVNVRGTAWAWTLGSHPRAGVDSTDPCLRRVTVPQRVEAVLAHEYNHVLQASQPGEFANDPNWLLEGMATWAARLVGYNDPQHPDVRSAQLMCLYGDFPDCRGGASASLTSFGLVGMGFGAEYGAAWSFMELLDSRYGHGFLGDMVRRTGVWGADKVNALLAERGLSSTFDDLVTDWSGALALDGVLDDGAQLLAGDASRYQVSGLHAHVSWDNPFSYSRPTPIVGVAPNASHYVRLQGQDGTYLDGAHLTSLDFDGDTRLDCAWVVDPDAHGAGNPALYSGGFNNGQNRDVAIDVDVPADAPTLDFTTKYQTEPGYDFGYVQVSDDGGRTWHSLATADTTSAHDPQALPAITAELPGFNGDSGGWRHEHADLSAYAGKHVLVGFRYRTDPGLALAGFWIDDVTVGGHLLSDGSTLDGWHNLPPLVHKLLLRLVSWTDDHRVARISDVPLDANNDAHLDAAQLAALVAPGAQTVAAVVTHLQDDPFLYCAVRFALSADGLPQHGG